MSRPATAQRAFVIPGHAVRREPGIDNHEAIWEDLRDGSAMSVIMDLISFLPRMRGRLRAKRAGRGKYQLAQSKPAPLHRAYARSPPPHFVRGRMLTRRQQHRAAFAEADARIILFGAKAFEVDLVAVLDEAGAVPPVVSAIGLAPARSKFEEAAPAILVLRARTPVPRAGPDRR